MSACTCGHVRSDHRAGVGRCTRPGCTCLFGPPPARRQSIPRPRAEGVGHTDGSGIVQDFQRVVRESERTKLERMLWRRIEEAGLPQPVKEYRWARDEGRMYRCDGAYLEDRILLEVEGGIFMRGGGGHNRPMHFQDDCAKYNLAALLGWRVLRFTKDMIKSNEADGAVETIRRALADIATSHQLALTGGQG